MEDLVSMFCSCKWKYRLSHNLDVSNNTFHCFEVARQRSLCVVFVLTPNFDKDKDLNEFLPTAIRKSHLTPKNSCPTPVVAISDENNKSERIELGARNVIKYSRTSDMWKQTLFNSIDQYMTENGTAGSISSSPCDAICGKEHH